MADQCKSAIKEKLGEAVSDEEIDDILERLRSAKDYAKESGVDESPADAVGRVSADIQREAERAKIIAERNAYKNIVVLNEARQQVAEAGRKIKGVKGLYNGVESILYGINTPIKGAQRSAAGLGKALKDHWFGGLHARLRKEGVLADFKRMKPGSDLERQVAVGMMHHSSEAGGKANISESANKIAKALVDLQETARQRQNQAGADILKMRGFIAHQTHDRSVMQRHGFEAWADNIRSKIDFEGMKIAKSRREEYLQSTYNSIVSGVRKDKEPTPLSDMFKGSQNLAKSMSRSRQIKFKTGQDFLDYNRIYGSGSLQESVLQSMTTASKNVGVMELLGTNPSLMLDRIIDDVSKSVRDTDLASSKYLSDHRGHLQARLDVVTGNVNIGSDTTIAKVGEWARAIKTMATLGGSVVSAQTDFSFNAVNRMYHGRSMVGAWSDALASPIQAMGKDGRHVADLLGAGLDTALGSVMSRFSSDDYIPGGIHRAMNTFFKLNLLGPFTDSGKAGATMILSRDFANMAGKAFGGLTPEYRRLLNIYGIDAKQWDVIRAAKAKAEDGREYILPGDIENLSGSLFTGMSKFQQAELKRKAKENLATLYAVEADFAAPTPGAREQAIMKTVGSSAIRPDSVVGQALRMFWQFKSFGLTATTKVVGRATYGGGSNMQMANLIAGSFLLGVAVIQLKELMRGNEPLEINGELALKGLLQGGAAGLYADFLLGADYSQYGRSAAETVAGPIPGDLFTAIEFLGGMAWSSAKGDPEVQGRDLVGLIKGNIPGANLFYLRMVLDYAVWYQLQELMNPGYVRRMERNLKNRTGQEMWLPPSDFIQTGGGFR